MKGIVFNFLEQAVSTEFGEETWNKLLLERNVLRSQNRIESYHQLRSTIAHVGGKKELSGRADIEIEISNQCVRLIAYAIIYYNSAILSQLLTKYEASGNAKAVELNFQLSPAA